MDVCVSWNNIKLYLYTTIRTSHIGYIANNNYYYYNNNNNNIIIIITILHKIDSFKILLLRLKTLVSSGFNWPKSGWISNQNYHFNCWRLETCTAKQWNLITLQDLHKYFQSSFLRPGSSTPDLTPDPAYCPTTTKLVWLYSHHCVSMNYIHTPVFPESWSEKVGSALVYTPHFHSFPIFHWTCLEETDIIWILPVTKSP